MLKTFNCPSCSAPLKFAGAVTQKCDHCGGTVIAPSEMFYSANTAPFNDLSGLKGRALRIAEVQRLIRSGNKIEAIKVFREAFGTGLKEAKDAVEAIERGESIDVTEFKVQTHNVPEINIDVDPVAVKKAAKTVGGIIFAIVLVAVFIGFAAAGIGIYFALSASTIKTSETAPPEPAKAAPVPKAKEASPLVEVMKIGGEGNGQGRFKDNRHIAVDGKGRIYSSDYSPMRIQVFEADGTFVNQWTPESGSHLYGLAADREGDLFVASDRGVSKYEGESGELLGKIDTVYPRGMALSWDGKIVVTEGRSFSVFDKSLKQIAKFADAAERVNSSFGFEEVAIDGDGTIYMLGRTDKDVFKFKMDGRFIDRFAHGGNSPNAIAIDPKGRIFVADTSSIKVLDADGNRLADLKATQAFGLTFNAEGDLFLASRPYVTKYNLEL